VNGDGLPGMENSAGLSMLSYLEAQTISYTQDVSGVMFPARVGLLLSAVSVTGGASEGLVIDLVNELEASFHWSTGVYSTTASGGFSSGAAGDFSQAWALLGLGLAGQPVPAPAVGYLLSSQAADGSWGFGDLDTTALTVIALLASGQVQPGEAVIQNALTYFRTTQLPNGGWRPTWDTDPLNADSTGWIIQALISSEQDLSTWTASEGDPVGALAGLQKPDGSIGGTYANTYSTAEALLGLATQPLISLAQPWQPDRSGLVVQFAEGEAITVCVRFGNDSLTGYEVLVRSGLAVDPLTDPSMGVAVCGIENTGCPVSDCFCGMPNYWSYWQAGSTGWAYAATGSGQSLVTNGSVEGWSWGEGIAPASYSFQDICQYGDAPVSLDGATATPTPDLPPATSTVEATTPPQPVEPTTVPVSPSATPTGTTTSGSGGFMYLIFGLLVLWLGLSSYWILRNRKK
jgi:hypothetical protein